jgi:catalase
VKPEPDNEMPQAASAHDTFWDFISLMPESMHMIPVGDVRPCAARSFRMMEGFGVHTFRLIDEAGTARFVKFHWKPLLGVHSVAWDEAQKISGKDPDFLRRDLWDAIESANYPEWSSACRWSRSRASTTSTFDLLDPDEAHPGGARSGRAHRTAHARIATRQLLRRDRAGRLPPGPHRARHRLHQRPACSRAGSSPTPTRS